MRLFLYIIGTLFLLGGLSIWSMAQSALHEIEAILCMIMVVLCYGLGGVIGAIQRQGDDDTVKAIVGVQRRLDKLTRIVEGE